LYVDALFQTDQIPPDKMPKKSDVREFPLYIDKYEIATGADLLEAALDKEKDVNK
jgi:hypothetical protein